MPMRKPPGPSTALEKIKSDGASRSEGSDMLKIENLQVKFAAAISLEGSVG